MIQKMRALLLMCALLLVLGVGSAFADTYFIYNDFGGDWIDVNKTWDDDYNMCWAAAISNVLGYGAWGIGAYPTAADIFAHFKATWPDVGGLPRTGFYWWLNGLSLPGEPHPPGGNFWPAYNAFTMSDGIFPSLGLIESSLRSGYMVTLGITSSSGGAHALTCWGVEYLVLPGGEPGSEHRGYTSIFVTDSDDDRRELLQVHVTLNDWGRWDLGDRFSGWTLTSAESFEMRPVMNFDYRLSRAIVTLDPLHELKEVFKLHPFLSFDYRWDRPFPQDPSPEGRFTIKALTDDNQWILLFEDYYDLEELGVWTAVNLQIPDELLGLRTLLFEMEGYGQLSLYRLDYVPLPPSLWLLASGLAGLLAWRRLPS
jgi:hypothetical protein